ncbi:hypothetical protein ACFPH6_02810 [Streptomyces xiangluensis]|uniref:Uncharacterized protein n=1 Tax=Streptomyces xiangluensis TaxID=2665720 RepID=A0ABV8YI65_9ACTN
MTGRYPIVRHRELRPRWRWSAWRERRHPLIAGRSVVLVHDEGVHDRDSRSHAAHRRALVNVRPGRRVSVHWELTAHGSDCDFPVTVTFRCTVVDYVEVARSWRTSAPWDVQYVLAQDDRPWGLQRTRPEGDEDGLRQP